MDTLGQEMNNLQSEQQEHRVSALEANLRTVDSNQKGSQNAARFCNYCRPNGHTPSWCRKKIREDKELKRIENERVAQKKVTVTQDYKKNEDQIMDQNNGPEAKIFKQEARTLTTTDLGAVLLLLTRTFLRDITSEQFEKWKTIRSTPKSVLQQKRCKPI